MTLPVYSLKREATLPDQQAWHTGQLTFDLSFHLSRKATPQPILWLLQGRWGHSWHSSTVLCWAMRASTHQHYPFTQEISVKPNGLYSRVCKCVCECVQASFHFYSYDSWYKKYNNDYYVIIIGHLCMTHCVLTCIEFHMRNFLHFEYWFSFFFHISLLIQTLISSYVDIAKLRVMGGGRWIEKIERLLEQMRHGGRSKRAHLYDL